MQLHVRPVVETFIAQIEHEARPFVFESLDQLVMIVDVIECIWLDGGERRLQPHNRIDVLGIEPAVALDPVRPARVAQEHHDGRPLPDDPGKRRRRHRRGQQHAICH